MNMQHDVVDEPYKEKQVIDYLRATPGFFEKNLGLLAELRISHPTGATVSLIERQVEVLRQQNRQLKGQMKDLMQIARDNDGLNARMHHFVVTLLHTASLDELVQTLYEVLHKDFAADTVALRLFHDPQQPLSDEAVCIKRDDEALSVFEDILKEGKPACGHYRPEQLQPFFGSMAEAVSSVALLPIGGDQVHGLLVIGSHDENRFQPTMGTLYLTKVGEIISEMIQRHIN